MYAFSFCTILLLQLLFHKKLKKEINHCFRIFDRDMEPSVQETTLMDYVRSSPKNESPYHITF